MELIKIDKYEDILSQLSEKAIEASRLVAGLINRRRAGRRERFYYFVTKGSVSVKWTEQSLPSVCYSGEPLYRVALIRGRSFFTFKNFYV